MTKISFIGAGSMEFTRRFVRDVLTFPLLQDATFCLMDIDAERLDWSRQMVEKYVAVGNHQATIEVTQDRAKALKGADFVVVTILAGTTDVWQHDIRIPKKYGVNINIGDTRGPAGIFRALRTIPVMVDIVRDMERYCPEAVMLNYTNPMAMLCRALQRETFITVTGLCHSVQGTAEMLAGWIGALMDEVTYRCAGINHQAWYLDFEWNGVDAYPLIHKAITERPEIYQEEVVRNEMYLHLGHYVTESSGHNSEYNWWFRKRPDLIEQYCTHGTGWNPGEYAYILNEYMAREDTWRDEMKAFLNAKNYQDQDNEWLLQEYAAFIINALLGGKGFVFNGNVPNTSIITNLPENACVEVPVYVDKAGFHPIHVGDLPPHLLALNHITVMSEEMAVEGALTGDPELIYHAIAYDPLTAAVLSLAEIKTMVNEMFAQNKAHLPQFKHFSI